jgi:hypothetical protein
LAPRIVEAEFGPDGERASIASLLHPGADGGFALAAGTTGKPAGIDVAGIDECPAALEEQIEQLEGHVLVDPAPDQVRAEAQLAHLDGRGSQLQFSHARLTF